MNIKTHRNHKYECFRRSLEKAILLWQWEIHARRFIHGAVHLLELSEHSLNTSQRILARVAQNYLTSQLLLEMIKRFLKSQTQFQIRYVPHLRFESTRFVHAIPLVKAKLHMASLKHSMQKPKVLQSIFISTGLLQSESQLKKTSALRSQS
ncbi:unannotated protein [freshwater metagenome]|uniref:Unannotated protein n=1 Tax=freshwater metagenome TaxID=449393 RepID=A0A6J6ZUY6_9ZZZZ